MKFGASEKMDASTKFVQYACIQVFYTFVTSPLIVYESEHVLRCYLVLWNCCFLQLGNIKLLVIMTAVDISGYTYATEFYINNVSFIFVIS